ncbi:MAG: hypothetical protein K0R08_1347 [Solimicrobium sp.]|jgi:hypothetical protein|nr:hypothetical protein [Solimicrobium sp.]
MPQLTNNLSVGTFSKFIDPIKDKVELNKNYPSINTHISKKDVENSATNYGSFGRVLANIFYYLSFGTYDDGVNHYADKDNARVAAGNAFYDKVAGLPDATTEFELQLDDGNGKPIFLEFRDHVSDRPNDEDRYKAIYMDIFVNFEGKKQKIHTVNYIIAEGITISDLVKEVKAGKAKEQPETAPVLGETQNILKNNAQLEQRRSSLKPSEAASPNPTTSTENMKGTKPKVKKTSVFQQTAVVLKNEIKDSGEIAEHLERQAKRLKEDLKAEGKALKKEVKAEAKALKDEVKAEAKEIKDDTKAFFSRKKLGK